MLVTAEILLRSEAPPGRLAALADPPAEDDTDGEDGEVPSLLPVPDPAVPGVPSEVLAEPVEVEPAPELGVPPFEVPAGEEPPAGEEVPPGVEPPAEPPAGSELPPGVDTPTAGEPLTGVEPPVLPPLVVPPVVVPPLLPLLVPPPLVVPPLLPPLVDPPVLPPLVAPPDEVEPLEDVEPPVVVVPPLVGGVCAGVVTGLGAGCEPPFPFPFPLLPLPLPVMPARRGDMIGIECRGIGGIRTSRLRSLRRRRARVCRTRIGV